jgi:hypothetical protein
MIVESRCTRTTFEERFPEDFSVANEKQRSMPRRLISISLLYPLSSLVVPPLKSRWVLDALLQGNVG